MSKAQVPASSRPSVMACRGGRDVSEALPATGQHNGAEDHAGMWRSAEHHHATMITDSAD